MDSSTKTFHNLLYFETWPVFFHVTQKETLIVRSHFHTMKVNGDHGWYTRVHGKHFQWSHSTSLCSLQKPIKRLLNTWNILCKLHWLHVWCLFWPWHAWTIHFHRMEKSSMNTLLNISVSVPLKTSYTGLTMNEHKKSCNNFFLYYKTQLGGFWEDISLKCFGTHLLEKGWIAHINM